jgi:hypothetical protein
LFIADSLDDEEQQREELQRLVEDASGALFTDEESMTTDEELEAQRSMAIAIESRSRGKGKGKGKGKETKKQSRPHDNFIEIDRVDIVKTCRCMCPLQHALLKQEYTNALLNEKKMKLEILKLEKDLNS